MVSIIWHQPLQADRAGAGSHQRRAHAPGKTSFEMIHPMCETHTPLGDPLTAYIRRICEGSCAQLYSMTGLALDFAAEKVGFFTQRPTHERAKLRQAVI